MLIKSEYIICHTGTKDEYYIVKLSTHKYLFGLLTDYTVEYMSEDDFHKNLIADVKNRRLMYGDEVFGKLITMTKEECKSCIDAILEVEEYEKGERIAKQFEYETREPNERYPK